MNFVIHCLQFCILWSWKKYKNYARSSSIWEHLIQNSRLRTRHWRNSKNSNISIFLNTRFVKFTINDIAAEVKKNKSVYSRKFFVPMNNETILKVKVRSRKKAANSILPLIRPRWELMPKIAQLFWTDWNIFIILNFFFWNEWIPKMFDFSSQICCMTFDVRIPIFFLGKDNKIPLTIPLHIWKETDFDFQSNTKWYLWFLIIQQNVGN